MRWSISHDGKRLYVANADNNDVAVIDISKKDDSKTLGFIPTGWYPTALALSPDDHKLFVGTGKGLSFRGQRAHEDRLSASLPQSQGSLTITSAAC